MSEHTIIICGLSMEMELAEEMGLVGDCRMCWYFDYDGENETCHGKILKERKTDCKEWFVDIR